MHTALVDLRFKRFDFRNIHWILIFWDVFFDKILVAEQYLINRIISH